MDPFIGEIRCFSFGWAPTGWMLCNGQLLPISQYTALFSLVGTTYGGDGRQTFALPDLRGRVPLTFGQGPGPSPYELGQAGGAEQVTLTPDQLPAHNHTVAASATATSKSPADAMAAVTPGGSSYGTTSDLSMSDAMVAGGGQGAAHENRQPLPRRQLVHRLDRDLSVPSVGNR